MIQPSYDDMMDRLQRDAFAYFMIEANPANGLVKDCTRPGFPSSIAAVGLALAAYPVGVERGLLTRAEAVARALTTLRFFWYSPQGPEPDATGHKGFYYHFLDMDTGRRARDCELSTIDTALLLAGALAAAFYFDQAVAEERDVRELADALYHRTDWQWAQNGEATVTHGWKPESGFLPYRWRGYDEATILYLLGLGSPTHPLPAESYTAYTSTYCWKTIYGHELLYAGPLFIHQYSHLWVDFRGIQDDFMRARGIDYFENSRRATCVHQQYAIRNHLQFNDQCNCCWGLTASDGPGPATLLIDGIERRFYDYLARGAPFGPDDGTIAPWAAVASLPFAPEIVLPTIQHMIWLGVGPPRCTLWPGGQLQPNVPGADRRARLGVPVELRAQPGAARPDGGELPIGTHLEPDAPLPLLGGGVAQGRFFRRLVGEWSCPVNCRAESGMRHAPITIDLNCRLGRASSGGRPIPG